MEHSQIEVIRCENCGEIINRPDGARGPVPRFCAKSSCNSQHRDKAPGTVEFNVKFVRSWSKFEGDNSTLDKKTEYDWYCQACNCQFPKEMTPMLYPIDIFGKEYIKICGRCYKKSVEKKISDFRNLINYIRNSF